MDTAKRLHRGTILSLAVCILVSLSTAQSAHADIVGTWLTGEAKGGGRGVIRMYKCSGKICGRLVNVIGTDAREVIGTVIVVGMSHKGKGIYSGGRVFAPDDDKWYHGKMRLRGNTLSMSGCVLGGLICRSQNWKRYK